jgi:hypothetical protein
MVAILSAPRIVAAAHGVRVVNAASICFPSTPPSQPAHGFVVELNLVQVSAAVAPSAGAIFEDSLLHPHHSAGREDGGVSRDAFA